MADEFSLRNLYQKAGKVVEEAIPQDSALRQIGQPSKTPEISLQNKSGIADQIINAYGKDFGNPYAGIEKAKEAASQIGANLAYRGATGEVKQDASASDVGKAVASNAGLSEDAQKYAGMAASVSPMIASMALGSAPSRNAVQQIKSDKFGNILITGLKKEGFREAKESAIQSAANLAKELPNTEAKDLAKDALKSMNPGKIQEFIDKYPELGKKFSGLIYNKLNAIKSLKTGGQ